MKYKDDLSYELVNSILRYNSETGEFIWKVDRGKFRCKNKIAGTVKEGYCTICILGKLYRAHRLAWLLMIGEWPENYIDHINGNKLDNRWCNLREATHFENMRNRRKSSKSTSGFKGVYWHKSVQKWTSGIFFSLGYFNTPEEAALAYNKAAKKIYGEFAKLNDIKP